MRTTLLALGLLTTCALIAAAGQGESVPNAPPKPPHESQSQYFSGWVAELSPGTIVVARKSPGMKKSFLVDTRTKVDGKLAKSVRVTVRWESTPDGDRAVRIIVRG